MTSPQKFTENPAIVRARSGPVDARAVTLFEDETKTVGWNVRTARTLSGVLITRATPVRFETVNGVVMERSFPLQTPDFTVRHEVSRLTRNTLVAAHNNGLAQFREKLADGQLLHLHPSESRTAA